MHNKIFKCVSALVISLSVILTSNIVIYAKDGDYSVVGKVYTFSEDNPYNFSKKEKYKLSNAEDAKTYGKFTVNGNIVDFSESKKIPVIDVSSGNLTLSYTYGDSILKAEGKKRHLVKDNTKKLNKMDLGKKIKKGTIIVQTSKDKHKWVDQVIKTNVFEDVPIETGPLYETTDVQLMNGCYYRVIVGYKTDAEVGSEKFLKIYDKVKHDVKKYAEVYTFYAINEEAKKQIVNTQKFSLGSKSKVASEGYVNDTKVKKSDSHYGWELGEFFVSGYTSRVKDSKENNVFLKNVGDKVSLWFNLNYDINRLNNTSGLNIGRDDDAYDQYFETPRTDFGKGTLIVQYTDFQNVKHEPLIYTNYLEANAIPTADTKVQLCEEGDYEVALDYLVESDGKMLGFIPNSDKTHYRTFFKFSVRNGNCMAFPTDIDTGVELTNAAFTNNGFKLDLAKSRYLDVNIKREVLNEGSNGLVEDVRFNRPAKEGDEYTEEGIYTITVSNKYTKQTTEKIIYVGDDNLLKAYVVTGLPLKDIQIQVKNGSTINDDGTIINLKSTYVPKEEEDEIEVEEVKEEGGNGFIIFLGIAVVIAGIGAGFYLSKKKEGSSL